MGDRVTYFRTVKTDPPLSVDAFSRLRTSDPAAVFDASFEYSLQSLLFEQVTAQAGATVTHDATEHAALMTFAATPTGGAAYVASHQYFRYQPGRSQLVFLTGCFNETAADVTKFVGYGDADDGIFFEQVGGVLQWTVRSSTSAGDETVTQVNWNIDPLDGTGPSGYTLDVTGSTFIAGIQFQWLGVGRVTVFFDIGGDVVPVHVFDHANELGSTTPYMKSGNLPVRAGMTCTGTATTTMLFICVSVISEGGQVDVGGYGFSHEFTGTAGNNVAAHIGTVRPKLTFNSITNRTQFLLDGVDVMVTGNQPVKWELVIGQTLAGTPSWADVNTTHSAVEADTAGTLSGSPAVILASGYVASGNQTKGQVSRLLQSKYPITLTEAGANRDLGQLTLLATGVGGTSALRASLSWREIR